MEGKDRVWRGDKEGLDNALKKLKNKMTKKKPRMLFAGPKIVMQGNLFYAKLCMHIKITRSYKK
jgi:threonyl-tRNA synthetase